MHRVASLCNQLFPDFLSKQFEKLHRCHKHIEDVHETFCREEKNVEKIIEFET